MKNKTIQTSPIPMTFWRSSVFLLVTGLLLMNVDVFALSSCEEEGNAESLSCIGSINLSLDADGCVTIIPEMLLLGNHADYGIFEVDIMGVLTDSVCCTEIGHPLMVSVSDTTTGNSCWSTVIVEDKLAPMITCMDVSLQCNEVLDESNMAQFITISDNCTHANDLDIYFTDVVDDPMCDPLVVATIDRTWYVTDQYGNQSSCMMTITYTPVDINDVVFPNDTIIYCPDPEISSDSLGFPTIDNLPISHFCEFIVFSSDQEIIGHCSGESQIRRTWTVMDWCDPNVISMDIQIIDILDTLPPVIDCPTDSLRLNTNALNCLADYVIPPVDVTDSCSDDDLITVQVFNGGVATGGVGSTTSFPLGNSGELMYVAIDDCGNRDTCVVFVVVSDNVQPSLICPGLMVMSMGNNSEVKLTTSDFTNITANDNCGLTDTLISIMDNECVADDLIPGDCITFCCDHIGNNPMVILTVFDADGNSNTCMFEVEVQDKAPPEIVCQDITVFLSNDPTTDFDPMDALVSATDNCGIDNVTANPNTVTCADIANGVMADITVTDIGGLSTTCTVNVTVIDNMAPTAMCQDITVDLDATGNVTIVGTDIDNGSVDGCDIVSYALDVEDFDCTNSGQVVPVVLTLTDEYGNVSMCNADVTVSDITPPVCMTQNITINLTDLNDVTISTTDIDNGSSDECATLSLGLDITEFGCDDIGVNDVILTATDGSGNVSECMATVTVTDMVAPTCMVDDITIFVQPAGTVTVTIADFNVTSADVCGGTADATIADFEVDCSDVGDNFDVTITVTDGSGNVSDCMANVAIEYGPILCPPLAFVISLDDVGNTTLTATDVSPDLVLDCNILTAIGFSQSMFDCSDIANNPQIIDVTYQIAGGGTIVCPVDIVIEDNTIPDCGNIPDVTVALDANGEASVTPAMFTGFTDACGIANVVVNPSMFTCADIGANAVGVLITDNNGNVAFCPAAVQVDDLVPPTIMCPADMTISCQEMFDLDDLTAFGVPVANDDCGFNPIVVDMPLVFDDACGILQIIRTFTVEDFDGNEVSCNQVLVVEDTDGPIVTAAPDFATPGAVIQFDMTGGNCEVPLVVTFDDCSNINVLANDGLFANDNAGSDATGVYPLGMHTINFTAIDCRNNVTTHTLMIDVISSDGTCPPPLAQEISGRVTTLSKEPISNVVLSEEGGSDILSDADGQYRLEIANEASETVSFSYEDDWHNGVNVQDVRLLHRYILGDEEILPAHVHSTDIQGDNRTDYQDLTMMQHTLLHMTTLDQSWTFVRASDIEFTEIERDVFALDSFSESDEHFFGIKLGDLNGDATIKKGDDPLPMMEYLIENRTVEAGETFDLELEILQGDINAIQYSIHLGNDIALIDLIIEEGSGTNTMSHYDEYSNTVNILAYAYDNYDYSPQISLRLESAVAGTLEEILNLDETVQKMAYTSSGEAYDLELRFGGLEPDMEANLEIKSNFRPNPFSDFTEVSFEVFNEKEEVQFEIYNAAGQKIFSETQVASRGLETRRFQRDIFQKAGVYYVTIRTATTDTVSKLVLLK